MWPRSSTKRSIRCEKKITREYRATLNKAERKAFRAQMWAFRRDPEGLTAEDMLAGLAAGNDVTLPRFQQIIQHRGGKSAGAIRVSLGLASNFDDVETFLDFAAELRDKTQLTIGAVTFDIESCRVIRDGA